MNPCPPLPPFTEATARQKVQAAGDAWNSRDPERVSLAYTEDTHWRERAEFVNGRAQAKLPGFTAPPPAPIFARRWRPP